MTLQRLLILSAAAVLGTAVAAPQVPPSPAGKYVCQSSSSPILNGQIQLQAFSLYNSVTLDGEGKYTVDPSQRGPGKYSYDAARGQFSFKGGDLSSTSIRYDYTDDGFKTRTFTLQFVDADSGRDRQTYCSIRAKTTGKALSNVKNSASRGSSATSTSGTVQPSASQPNPGLKGTLVFYESYNVLAIQSLDFATGKTQTQLSGGDPFLAKNGELVYVNRQNEIVVADKAYQRVATVKRTDEVGDVSQPALSLDGQRVAYEVDAYPSWKGVVVRSRGGQLLTKFELKLSPSWTPDGRLVVAENTGYEGRKPALYLSSADLRALNPLPIKVDDLTHPSLSPDGKQMAFVGNRDLWTVDLDGSNLKRRTSTDEVDRSPTWSPDGQSLVFTVDYSGVLNVLRLKTGEVQTVLDSGGERIQAQGGMFWR